MLASGTTDGGSNVNSNESTGSLTSNGPGMLPPPIVIPKQARILVVEDNEFNWEVVKCFLQEDDHLLQWEVNGHEAVTAYIDHYLDFDLIFMDCEMPVMDGYTATATIRQFELENHLPRIPILGLTAYAMSGDRQKCLEAGMDEFMVKPISKVSLLQAIRQWMRIRYLRQKNAKESASSPSSSNGNTPRTGTPTAGVLHKSQVLKNKGPASNPLVAPTPRNSFDGVTNDEAEPAPSRLAPASRHMQQLDLARAISNLELDDPMAIARQGGRAFRTAAPSTSIFSLGSGSLFGNSTRSSSSGLLNFQRDAGGAIVDVPDWKQMSKTSTTLPYTKEPLFPSVAPSPIEQRSSYPKNPTLWSHPPFKKEPQPSPLSLAQSQVASSNYGTLGKASSEFSFASLMNQTSSGDAQGGGPPNLRRTHTEGDVTSSSTTVDPLGIAIPEGDPVNYSLGVEQCGGREELFLNLLEKFALGCDSAMARILAAADENDIILARREAHSLKGSSAYAAALRVSKSAFRVQIACDRLVESQGGAEAFDSEASVDPKAKALVDESIALLRKEHRLLTGYLRRNFVFRGAHPPGGSTTRQNSVGDRQEKGAAPCTVM
ncbi:Hybrid signal transduction histidine kinase [Globisporangium polare]